MTDAIAIRKKVAELCGFSEVGIYAYAGDTPSTGNPIFRGMRENSCNIIPPYELSLDAIEKAFDEHGLTYTLQKQNYKDTGGSGYIAVNGIGGTHYSDTAAKAMCYLFIHCMEKKEL